MMDSDEVKRRIEDASDDDEDLTFRGVYHTGEGEEGILYHLVIATKRYDGQKTLKMRYFALHPDSPEDDTWMKNGITTRVSDGLLGCIISSLGYAKDEMPEEVCRYKDLSEEL